MLAVAEGDRDRVDGEIAPAEVELDRLAAKSADIGVPGAVGRQRAPGPELLRELEGDAAAGSGDSARGAECVGGDREVEVDDLATGDRVADGATDDPGGVLAARQRLVGDDDGLRLEQRSGKAFGAQFAPPT